MRRILSNTDQNMSRIYKNTNQIWIRLPKPWSRWKWTTPKKLHCRAGGWGVHPQARRTTRIELVPEVLDDYDRFSAHIAQFDPI